MTEGLSPLDRATLFVWRALNIGGWSAVATIGAVALQFWAAIQLRNIPGLGFGNAFDLFGRPGAEEGIDDSLAKFGLRIAMTLLVALWIGSVLGLRAWRRPMRYAAIAAAIYAVYTIGWLEQSTSTEIFSEDAAGIETHIVLRTRLIDTIFYDLVVTASVPLSAWWAKRVAARRGLARVSFN